jgi:hypothetical protein
LPAYLQSASLLFAVKPGLEWRRKRRVSRSVSGPGHPQRRRNGGSSRSRAGKPLTVWGDGLQPGGAALVRLTRVCAGWLEAHLISSYTTLELPWSEAERPAVWVRLRVQSAGRGAGTNHWPAKNHVFWGGGREKILSDQRKPGESGAGQGHSSKVI